MKTLLLSTCLLAASLTISAGRLKAVSSSVGTNQWSQDTNGLQARLVLVEKEKLYGTRWLVPYLELRNVRDLSNQVEVNLDGRHLEIELVNGDGEPVRSGWSLSRSGPTAELNTVILPRDSSIRISLENRNWGIPPNAAAMVSTDSGAWVIPEGERGKVFLRATLTGEQSNPPWKTWNGTLQTQLVRVDWK
jgi:hypothetical protein